MRLYQWLALLSMGFGVALSTFPGAGAPGLVLMSDVRLGLAVVLYGILAGLAMGVDFPGSARRFARLAPS